MMARSAFMTRTWHRGAWALLVTGALIFVSSYSSPLLAALQGERGKTPVQERLNRIGNELVAGRGSIKQAIQELKEILAIDPRSPQAHLLLGIAYRIMGSPDFIGEAAAEFRQALALEPGFLPARLYLAQVYLDLGRAERAREELNAALEHQPGHPQFLALLGETERQLRNAARSVELNRQALKADPSLEQARYYLGIALFDLGARDEAIRELERVVQSGVKQADAFSSLGAGYLDAGRVDEALGALEQGLQLDPSRPDLRIQLARALRSKGQLENAQAQLEAITPAVLGAVASGFQQQQIEFDLYLERGLVALAQRRLAAAVAALQRTLSMDPNHGPSHRYLAEAYLGQGSYKRASEHAARAAKLGSPLPDDKRRLLDKQLQGRGAGTPK